MKKTILTVTASAVMVLFAVQFAVAAQHHSGKLHHRSHAEFRDSNAYAAPAYRASQPDYSGYAGLDGH